MVFSTSPGETPVVEAAHIRQYANMWRISDDFWDSWPLLNRQFDLLARWQGKGGPGHWPDADMIPLGHISKRCRAGGSERWSRLTYDEEVTLMSLWAINSSPLMLGMNLPDNDGRTLALISNDEVLSVDQDPLGNPAQCLVRAHGGEIWTKRLQSGELAVAMFNRSGAARDLTLYFNRVGIRAWPVLYDLWHRQVLASAENHFTATVPPHGSVLMRCQ
jgi:alpha-galactosidase